MQELLDNLSDHKDSKVRMLVELLQEDPVKVFHLKMLGVMDVIHYDLDMLKNYEGGGEGMDEDAPKPEAVFKVLGSKVFDNLMTLFKTTPAIIEAFRQTRIAAEIIKTEDAGNVIKKASVKSKMPGVAT